MKSERTRRAGVGRVAIFCLKYVPSSVATLGGFGPRQVTANTVPLWPTYSLTTVPLGVVSCSTLKLPDAAAFCDGTPEGACAEIPPAVAFNWAASVSIDAAVSPSVARAVESDPERQNSHPPARHPKKVEFSFVWAHHRDRAGEWGDRGVAGHLPGVPGALAGSGVRRPGGGDRQWRGCGDRDRGAAGPGEPVRAGGLDPDGVAAAGPDRRAASGAGAGGAGGGPGTGLAGRGGPGGGRWAADRLRRHDQHRPQREAERGGYLEETFGFHPLLAFLVSVSLSNLCDQWAAVLPAAMMSLGSARGLPEFHIHGDYHALNLRFARQDVTAILNWQASRWEKRIIGWPMPFFISVRWSGMPIVH